MLHLRPKGGWFGDPIPFYWDGVYHLFYLVDHEHHAQPGGRHTWGHFASRDLVHWDELPLVIDLGPEGAVDAASCGTGAIIERDGTFHLYYLGRYFTTNGERRETMCHATSADLISWQKDPANPISRPDPAVYNLTDWRDGFPYWSEAHGEYRILVTATLRDAPATRRGCLAALGSSDLWKWQARGTYWAPHLGFDHECPDLFRWGDWWYLVYSTVTDPATQGTLYRRARSPEGPWSAVPVESFDGPLLYAAKTQFDGRRRFLFGWVPTREGDRDEGKTQWGGESAVREIVQGADGYLWAKLPPEVLSLAGEPLPLKPTARLGDWDVAGGSLRVAPGEGFACALLPDVPQDCIIRFRFRAAVPTSRFGVLLRTDADLSGGYRLSLEPSRRRMMLLPFGARRRSAVAPLTRPWPNPTAETTVTIVVSGSIFEAFVDDRIALVGRFYDHQGASLALFVEDGGGEFCGVEVRPIGER